MNLIDTNLTSNDVERETEKAICVRVANGAAHLNDRLVWLPKSQVTWAAPKEQPNLAETIHVPAWLAGKL